MRFVTNPSRLIEIFFPDDILNERCRAAAYYKQIQTPVHWRARRPIEGVRAMVIGSCMSANESQTRFWQLYQNGGNLGGKVVIDPMSGSGTTVRAASGLGLTVIGGDINPLACYNAAARWRPEYARLLREALMARQEEWDWLFQTQCPQGHKARAAVFHYQCQRLCQCGESYQTYPYYVGNGVVRCSACGSITHPARCPRCNTVPLKPLNRCACGTRERGEFVGATLLIVTGICPLCGSFIKEATDEDRKVLQTAALHIRPETLHLFSAALHHPAWSPSGFRVLSHMATPRAILFWQICNDILSELPFADKLFFRLLITDIMWRVMSALCHQVRMAIRPGLSGPLVFPADFCELAPYVHNRSIFTVLQKLSAQRQENGPSLYMISDATHIPVREAYAIVTDPPYGDDLSYSHLNDLFQVVHPGLKTHYQIPLKKFARLMVEFMVEARRVLVPGGVVSFTFHSVQENVWRALAEALTKSNMVISAIWAVQNDHDASLARSAPLADVIVVCRRREEVTLTYPEYNSLPKTPGVARALQFGVQLASWVNGLDIQSPAFPESSTLYQASIPIDDLS